MLIIYRYLQLYNKHIQFTMNLPMSTITLCKRFSTESLPRMFSNNFTSAG